MSDADDATSLPGNDPPREGEHPGIRLRRLLERGCVGLPGAFNGLVARAVAKAGFGACYVSGAAVSASYGVPDVGLLTLNEFCAVIRQVAMGSGLPVLADADTGFGESEMVRRTVWDYHRAGAAGLHIEDQVFPKRCGHLDGKKLVPAEHMMEKISAAAQARDEIGRTIGQMTTLHHGAINAGGSCAPRGPMVICARTDARGVEGMNEAVDRAIRYIDAGADMIFPEGLHSLDEFKQFRDQMMRRSSPAVTSKNVRASPPPPWLLANMTEFGKTPIIPLREFERLGYNCVIWPVTTLRAAMGEVTRILGDLRRDGDVSAFIGRVQDRKALYELMGYTPGEEWGWNE